MLSLCDGWQSLPRLHQSTPHGHHSVNTRVLIPKGLNNQRSDDLRIRFFKRSLGGYDLNKQVHESISVKGRVKRAVGGIRHYGEDTIAIRMDKTNWYSSLGAQEKFAKGKKSSC